MNHNKLTHSARLLLLAALLLVLSACSLSPEEEYIQGYWTFANEFNNPQATEVHLLQEWWFGNGRYYFIREIWAGFPETSEGRYRILERDGDSITLEFFGVSSSRSAFQDGSTVTIVFEPDEDSLRVNRTLYYRSGP